VIKRQGGVMCEEFYNGKVEFAMEFFVDGNAVSFAGYSLFKACKGSYSGNILASDDDIELFLSKYIPLDELLKVKKVLPGVMASLLCGCGYVGYFGVDMMIYESDGVMRLNPCIELNLRMNMGMLARIFFDRYVAVGCKGEYRVRFFKNEDEAYAAHVADKENFPLEICNGKIESGYLNLSPVSAVSRYLASVVICKDNEINGGKVEIQPFTLGSVCFQNYCKFKDETAATVVRTLINRSYGYKTGKLSSIVNKFKK
jgi:hypothetical protein